MVAFAASRGGGGAPFLLGSLKFQLFGPKEVLETHPTPFLNELSGLEQILFLAGESL